MKNIILISVLFSGLNIFAQNPNDAIIRFTGGGTAVVQDFKSEQECNLIKGSFYYNDDWNNGNLILINDKTINGYPLKYDLSHNNIQIKTPDDIKIISIGAVKEVTWLTKNGTIEILKNCSLFKNSKEKIGFYSIVYNGNISLFKKTDLKILSSNYNGTVVAGDKCDKYVKENKYYIYTNDKIYSVKKNKRKILKFFNNKAEKVEEFASENNLSFKKEYDLAKIFNYYNSL